MLQIQESLILLTAYSDTFPKERHSSKQGNILILKAILFISQNMFQSIHTSSSVAKSYTYF